MFSLFYTGGNNNQIRLSHDATAWKATVFLVPANLRKAHIANDKAVDRLYRKQPFESERERVEHLFMLYEKLQSPILAASKPKPRKRKTRTVKTS